MERISQSEKIVTKHCIWSWRGGLQRIMICQGRLWNWNATSARRRMEDNGYCSDKGYNLLSKMWSREERDKEKRKKGIDVGRTDKESRGNSDNEEEMKESGDEVHGRSFLLLRNRLDKGQQNMGTPAKGTRSTTRGDVGPQREGKGKKKQKF
jgi:hypothetical protein